MQECGHARLLHAPAHLRRNEEQDGDIRARARWLVLAEANPLLRSAGHQVFTPTLTGLGERVHLVSPAIDLATHVQDVVNALDYEDLTEHKPGCRAAEAARAAGSGWSYRELATRHAAMVTAPRELMGLLLETVPKGAR